MAAEGSPLLAVFSAATLLSLLPAAAALSSHDCAARLHETAAAQRAARCLHDPICGTFPPSPVSFTERLSPQCADLLATYRSAWPQRGPTTPPTAGDPCPLARATQPHNPVVIATNTTATFVMCTVPKVGSTNTRKLLNTIISDPDPLILDAFEQIQNSHKAKYPNVGHFGVPDDDPATTLWQPKTRPGAPGSKYKPPSTVPDDVPMFTIGRNPYVRLVSGYRNKMVISPRQHDVWTRKLVNRDLGMPEETEWADTAADFRAFVRALAAMPKFRSINSHFRPSVPVCAGPHNFRYDYYLRLEELEQWLPCWMHGLALGGYTDRGWAAVGPARMYLGRPEEEQLVTYRWVSMGLPERPEWDAEAGRVTLGQEGRHWRWMKGEGCWWKPHEMSCEEFYAGFTAADGAVVPGGGGRGQADSHGSATADAWESFYDQAAADAVRKLYAVDFKAFRYPSLTVR